MAVTARRRPRLARAEAAAGYLFLFPTAVGFLVFVAGPLVAAIGLSLFDYDILSPPRFAGLANFESAFEDARLRVVYRNTLTYVVAWALIDVLLALALAVAINRPMHAVFRYLLRTAYFFPVLTSTASVAIIWTFLYNTDLGIVNYYLSQLGLPKVPWLTSSAWAIWSIVILQVWKAVGFNFVLFVAGLQNVPRHLYEAAAIDGAGGWASFRWITLPMLSSTMFFAVIISMINGFQIFDAAFIMTTGGPGDASRTVVMYIYENGFRFFRMGYASTVALSLFLVILLLTIVQFRLGRAWVHYQ
ncbi:MAG: sugar ABC transporter permease [Chloroflexota bacterium]|nr:MAG: sugar ABC transporter permease [Chloroflexota bacterium]